MRRIIFETRESILGHALKRVFEELRVYDTRPVLLDMGCADMRKYSVECASVSKLHTAMELDYGALRRGADRQSEPKQHSVFVNANAESLPFRTSSFDIVVLSDMLAYCNKPKVLQEAERVLKPGGYALSLHNNSIGWSFYKLRYPEKPMLTEWLHSVTVIMNSIIYKVLGVRLFRTTYNTKKEIIRNVEQANLRLIKTWTTKESYAWHHFIARKPNSGENIFVQDKKMSGEETRLFPTGENRSVQKKKPGFLSCTQGKDMSRKDRIMITGGYLSQNMGSAAMSIVTVKHLKDMGYDIVLLSKYPEEDEEFARRYEIRIRKANQLVYTFAVIPLLMFSKLIPGLIGRLRTKYFDDAVLFYDIGGITFSEERGFSGFVINATWLALPLLLGVPVVKGSQAVGPLRGWYHRLVSVPMLRRAAFIHARGNETKHELDRFGIATRKTPDIAFLLEKEPVPLEALNKRCITFIPSSVVMKRYDGLNGKGSYLHLMGRIVTHLCDRGFSLRVLAHSYRKSASLNSNDYPVCRELYEKIARENVILTDVFGKTPGNLKAIISKSELVITGRFHGMVAALGSGVPVIVTSWSHKYREVLDDFGLGDLATDWRLMDETRMMSLIDNTLDRLPEIQTRIRENLPMVSESSVHNFKGLEHYVRAVSP